MILVNLDPVLGDRLDDSRQIADLRCRFAVGAVDKKTECILGYFNIDQIGQGLD